MCVYVECVCVYYMYRYIQAVRSDKARAEAAARAQKAESEHLHLQERHAAEEQALAGLSDKLLRCALPIALSYAQC